MPSYHTSRGAGEETGSARVRQSLKCYDCDALRCSELPLVTTTVGMPFLQLPRLLARRCRFAVCVLTLRARCTGTLLLALASCSRKTRARPRLQRIARGAGVAEQRRQTTKPQAQQTAASGAESSSTAEHTLRQVRAWRGRGVERECGVSPPCCSLSGRSHHSPRSLAITHGHASDAR